MYMFLYCMLCVYICLHSDWTLEWDIACMFHSADFNSHYVDIHKSFFFSLSWSRTCTCMYTPSSSVYCTFYIHVHALYAVARLQCIIRQCWIYSYYLSAVLPIALFHSFYINFLLYNSRNLVGKVIIHVSMSFGITMLCWEVTSSFIHWVVLSDKQSLLMYVGDHESVTCTCTH